MSRRSSVTRTFRHTLGWGFVRVFQGLGGRFLTPSRNVSLGKILAKSALPFLDLERRHTFKNIDIAFDDKDKPNKEEFFERVIANFIRSALDTLYVSRGWPDRMWRLFDKQECEGFLDRLETISNDCGPLLIASAHFGNWELLGALVAMRLKVRDIVRNMHSGPLQKTIIHIRSKLSRNEPFIQEDSALKMVRFLKSGGNICIVPDQKITHNQGIYAPFFGRPAFTPTGPAVLSSLAKACLVCIFAYHDGTLYHPITEGPPLPPCPDRSEKEVRKFTNIWQYRIETVIRQYPDQWAWFHNRWKSGRLEKKARQLRKKLAKSRPA